MACYTPSQIAGLVRSHNNVWGGEDQAIAVAVALAEAQSCNRGGGRKTDSVGDGGDSIGLWQINDAHHGWMRTEWGITNPVQTLKDPDANVRIAAEVYKRAGNSWRPWTTYTNGFYRRHMETARAAIEGEIGTRTGGDVVIDAPGQIPGPGDVGLDIPSIGDVYGAIKDVAGYIIKAAQWLATPQNWVRIAEVGGGFILVAAAVSVLARPVIQSEVGSSIKGKIPS